MWRVINIALVALSAYGGYASMSADILKRTNSDAVACISVFLAAVFITIAGTYYGVHKIGLQRLSLPSLDRSMFGVWRDPLQYIFMLRWITLACLIAATLRLFISPNIAGGWMVGIYVSALIGFALGEAIVYRRFRDIVGTESAGLS